MSGNGLDPVTLFGASNMRFLGDTRVTSSMLDASDAQVTDGTLAKTWRDLSGRGNHFTNSTTDQQPKYFANAIGKPSLQFFWNGVFTFLSNADSTEWDYTNLSVYIVVDQITSTGTQSPYGKYLTTGNQREFDIRIVSAQAVVNSSSDGTSGFSSATATTTVSTATKYVISFTYDGTTKTVQVNNDVAHAGTDVASIAKKTGAPQFGAISGAVNPFQGHICYAVIANSLLNATNKAAFITSLMSDWGA